MTCSHFHTRALKSLVVTRALCTVLPEGFEALYSIVEGDEHEGAHDHRRSLLMTQDGFQAPDQLEGGHHHAHDGEGPPTSYAGLALLSGFVIMMAFEVWNHSHEHSASSSAPQVRNQLFECKVRTNSDLRS